MGKVSGTEYIHQSTKIFFDKIRNDGGWNIFLLALTAKILLLSLWYNVARYIVPLDDMLVEASVFILFAIFWGAIKDHVPSWVNDLFVTGKGYFELEIKTLNRYIFNLFLLHIFIFILGKNLPLDSITTNEE